MNTSTDAWTLAMQACDEAALIALVEQGHPVNGRRDDMHPPLVMAASLDLRCLARLLLDRHADPNATDSSGGTPLHWAALLDKPLMARLLIARGADVNARQPGGIAGGETPLHFAAQNSLKVLRVLLKAGADVHALVNSGSALHWAARANKPACVTALLVAGARTWVLTADCQTPLDVAQGQAKAVLAEFIAERERRALEAKTAKARGKSRVGRL